MDPYPVLTAERSPRTELTAPRRARWVPWWVVLGLVLLGGSFGIAGLSGNPLGRTTAPGDGSKPLGERRAVAVAFVDVEGGVRPLYPAVPGRVIEAPVPEGKEVEEGAVLLRIDDGLAQARLKEAKLDLLASQEKLVQAKKLVEQHQTRIAQAQATLEAARKSLSAAELQAKKARRLFQEMVGGSKEDIESAEQLVGKAKEDVKAGEAAVKLIQSMDPDSAVRLAQFDVDVKNEQVQKAELGVRECRIVAPCRGVILRRLVNVGEVLGQMPNRPAIEFCPSGDRIVRAEVEQEFAGKIRLGQKVRISDEITGEGDWQGEVIRISDWFTQRRAVLLEPMQYNDIRTLEVIITLKPDTKNPLRINQRVRVQIDSTE